MHGNPALAQALLPVLKAAPAAVELVICPPAVWLAQVTDMLKGTPAKTGGQDCAAQPEGAYTGDISAGMLKEAGASYVIIGHSERRGLHQESNDTVRGKMAQALRAGLVPILCVGETQAEREAGGAEAVTARQVTESLPDGADKSRFILAYEPVWAIGSGRTPTTEDIRLMHAHIQAVAAERTGLASEGISVLYGGSVKGDNASAIMATAGVAGVLVGGASLKVEEFGGIIAAAAA